MHDIEDGINLSKITIVFLTKKNITLTSFFYKRFINFVLNI